MVHLSSPNSNRLSRQANFTIRLESLSSTFRRMMSKPIVHLMRGLPGCGKSYTARRLAGNTGVVLETDYYFYVQVGSDPATYDYHDDLLPRARDWNFERFRQAIAHHCSPIVVDRGNGLNQETKRYAQYAVEHQYQVVLSEPNSPWWQEIRVLLKYKAYTQPVLDQWAVRLAAQSQSTHRVPAETIRRWMAKWMPDLTVQQILDLE